MNFQNKRFITAGADMKLNPLLQNFLWNCIDTLPSPKDYLQVFEFIEDNGKQKIIHRQEEPAYQKEYLLGAPFLTAKIFVIDDEDHSTMLLAEEY